LGTTVGKKGRVGLDIRERFFNRGWWAENRLPRAARVQEECGHGV